MGRATSERLVQTHECRQRHPISSGRVYRAPQRRVYRCGIKCDLTQKSKIKGEPLRNLRFSNSEFGFSPIAWSCPIFSTYVRDAGNFASAQLPTPNERRCRIRFKIPSLAALPVVVYRELLPHGLYLYPIS